MKTFLARCLSLVCLLWIIALAGCATDQQGGAGTQRVSVSGDEGDLFAEAGKPYKLKVRTRGADSGKVLNVQLRMLMYNGSTTSVGRIIPATEVDHPPTITVENNQQKFDIVPKVDRRMNILVQVSDSETQADKTFPVGYTVIALKPTIETRPPVNSPIGVGRN